MIKQITEQLKSDEGAVTQDGRHVAYNDHLGYLTIGYGRLVDRKKNGGLTNAEADYLLANDIDMVQKQLMFRLPWFIDLDEARQGALINMAFQLGVNGLMQFKRTLSLLGVGNYTEGAAEALRSKWAKQTPHRAKRVARQIETGLWK